jgi:putative oxidoreductase
MLSHGIPKLVNLVWGNVQFPSVFGLTPGLSLTLTIFAEVLCSIFILAGIGTRPATIPLIVTMMVAAFKIHAADPFAKQELPLVYLVSYIVLLIAGSGKYSVDYLLQRKSEKPVCQKEMEGPTLGIFNV